MMKTKLKLGIVGCGGIAAGKHLPATAKLSGKCEAVAFCDEVKERAVKLAKEYGTADAKVYSDYKELVADKNVDVVYVLTPNVSHSTITIAALENGKHVMCEKPMAHTSADAKKMLDAWKKSGKHFTIGYQNRFRPDAQALYKACAAGELGEIYYARAHALRRRAVPTWGVFPDKAKQGGGPLIDIGTHALDLTLWMMNSYKPVSVSGSVFYKLGDSEDASSGNMFGPWDTKSYEVEDSAFGLIKFAGGATVYLESSWALNLRDAYEACTTLCGTKAGAEIRPNMSGAHDLIYNSTRHGQLTEERQSPGSSIAFFGGGHDNAGAAEAEAWIDS
ncbi:MAG: Gfo/Idh/MocA family oxidoreductase, partial [Oscillospiraceae bacterium]|nr:Gfo/Idh/MocA family oxidoreductase [Oscillospiraceae bacterium]